jgi:hypothetical protein
MMTPFDGTTTESPTLMIQTVARRKAPRRRTACPSAATSRTATPLGPTKSALVTKLLSRARGATSTELAEATRWQPHTVRAFLSGLRKKGTVLVREDRRSGETAYRITAPDISVLRSPASDPDAEAQPSGVDGVDSLSTDNRSNVDTGSDGDA